MNYLAEQTGGGFMLLEQLMETRLGGNESPFPTFMGTPIQNMLLLRTCSPAYKEPVGTRTKLREYALHCYLFRVLDLRLQEGFRLLSVVSTKEENEAVQKCTDLFNYLFIYFLSFDNLFYFRYSLAGFDVAA